MKVQPFHAGRRGGGEETLPSASTLSPFPLTRNLRASAALLDRKERKPAGHRPKGEKAFGRVRRIVAVNEGLKNRTVAAVEGLQKHLKDFTGRPCRNRRLGESGDGARTEENRANERQCQSPQDQSVAHLKTHETMGGHPAERLKRREISSLYARLKRAMRSTSPAQITSGFTAPNSRSVIDAK